MEEIANLINNQVFQVDQMQNLQWKFSNETTLTIGGLAIPATKVHYSLSEENGVVFLNTNPKIDPDDPLIISIAVQNPVTLVITKYHSKKTLVTLRKP